MRIQTLDYHTAGEPLRILTGEPEEIPGDTMLAKRRFMQNHLDHLRKALMLEPRGHADMYGAVLTAPVTPDGDVGVLFMHNEGYSTMCGHGIIALVTAGLQYMGDEDLGFLYGTIFVRTGNSVTHSRNVCIFADGELDRSPTGTGVCGRAAIHHARGDIGLGQVLTIESILGTRFKVSCIEETTVGSLPAIVAEVTGSAHMTGEHQFVVDPADPLPEGFFIR